MLNVISCLIRIPMLLKMWPGGIGSAEIILCAFHLR